MWISLFYFPKSLFNESMLLNCLFVGLSMEAYAIAKRKLEERVVIKKALSVSKNKAETLRQFTRHESK
jgi:hypothetical protein